MTTGKGKIVVRDDLGCELVIDQVPRRIVSLVPSITETVVHLGAAERLVGVTSYCTRPQPVVARIAKVGGTKGVSLAKVEELRPDLIIANKEENRKQHIERLRKSFPVFVTYPRTVEQAMTMVETLGLLTGTRPTASAFGQSCRELLASLTTSIIAPPLKTACMIWKDPWMAAGPDSYMSDLLAHCGFANVFVPADGRYPQTTLEAVLGRKPDIIVLPDEPYEFAEQDKDDVESLLQARHVAARVLLMDGSYLTWFGARTLEGLRHLRDTRRTLQ